MPISRVLTYLTQYVKIDQERITKEDIMKELRQRIETLETLAAIYSNLDQVRMNEIVRDIKTLESKLLDLMVQDAVIE
jgi:Fe2+ or Zn2+ uptake regulation protein